MSHPSPDRKSRRRPSKPYPLFPLTAHPNGQWCKKIKGKVHFFGVWADSEAAHQRYLQLGPDLHAGRQPKNSIVHDGLTVKDLANKDLANKYLTDQLHRAEAGEISHRWFEDCRYVIENFASFTGTGRLVSDIMPEDFQRYREKLIRRGIGGKRGLGVHALTRAITVVRGMFKYAYDMDLIDRPVKFGKGLQRPPAALKRRSRQAAELENGKRLFTAPQVLAMLGADNIQLRAMILLGINGGFGNTDCASLPIAAIDFEQAVIDFNRPKTGIQRVAPLWPETVEALRQTLTTRPKPADSKDGRLMLLTKSGKPWVRKLVTGNLTEGISKVIVVDAIGQEFDKLLLRLGFKRKGLGFYTLRHTFRTWADEVKDQHAIHRIMGHVIPGMSGIYVEEISLERLRAVTEHVRRKLFSDPTAPTLLQPSVTA